MRSPIPEILDHIVRELSVLPGPASVNGWIHQALGPDIDIERKDTSAQALIEEMKEYAGDSPKVLDFGCGRGPHRALFERAGFEWIGLDYFDSGSIHFAENRPNGVVGYDGRIIPFPEACFRAVWSWQALEHVRNPQQSVFEIARVTAIGGCFGGSTSFLEPFHGYSTFSYSPFGLKVLLADHGFKLRGIYPGIDGITMVLRYVTMALGYDIESNVIHSRTISDMIDKITGSIRKSREIQLQTCGHFRFIAERVSSLQ